MPGVITLDYSSKELLSIYTFMWTAFVAVPPKSPSVGNLTGTNTRLYKN